MGFVVSHDFKNKKMCFWTNTLTDHSHVCELRSKLSRFERQEMYNATAYCIIQQLLNATKNSWPEFYLKNNPYYFSCKMGILTFQLLPIYQVNTTIRLSALNLGYLTPYLKKTKKSAIFTSAIKLFGSRSWVCGFILLPV